MIQSSTMTGRIRMTLQCQKIGNVPNQMFSIHNAFSIMIVDPQIRIPRTPSFWIPNGGGGASETQEAKIGNRLQPSQGVPKCKKVDRSLFSLDIFCIYMYAGIFSCHLTALQVPLSLPPYLLHIVEKPQSTLRDMLSER